MNIDNGLPLGDTVDYDNQRLITEPKKSTRKKYSLDKLVAKAKTQQPPIEIKTGRLGDEQ